MNGQTQTQYELSNNYTAASDLKSYIFQVQNILGKILFGVITGIIIFCIHLTKNHLQYSLLTLYEVITFNIPSHTCCTPLIQV